MPVSVKIILHEPDLEMPRKHFSISIKNVLLQDRETYSNLSNIYVISGKGHTFYSFTKRLIKAGIIDRHYRWKITDCHLVILGHLSHCPRTLWLIYGLEERARRRDSLLHYLPEEGSEQKIQPWLNETPDYAYHLRSQTGYTTILFDGHRELDRWLRTKKRMIKIGEKTFSTLTNTKSNDDIFTPENDDIAAGQFTSKKSFEA